MTTTKTTITNNGHFSIKKKSHFTRRHKGIFEGNVLLQALRDNKEKLMIFFASNVTFVH